LKSKAQKLPIILGSHVHVPYGAGDEEFEKAYSFKLKPFISALYKFPQIQGTLHYSGAFLNWVDRVYPECTMSIDDLVSRKQVELLGGGFYEPQFSLIPLQDKIGQVEMLTTYLRKRFGKKPQGCWLPALNWEQNLVAPLLSCGMAYTFLEEDRFRLAGLSGEDLYAPCISEDQGKLISVFPVARSLEALFSPGDQASLPFLSALSRLSGELPEAGSRVITVFPDPCRTMGSPGEAELYWHRFFQGLADSLSAFEFTTPGRFIRGRGGLKKAYFPSTSDRQYLIDYPEANRIYAKMVFSHMLINQLRGDKARKRTALEELWKAQGYDAFCPAESGGVYRGDLRKFAFRSLLEAEKITRENRTFTPYLMNFDFDLDNEDEYLFQGERINCYVRLEGAGMFELDYLPRSWNYLDTFAQPRELRRAGFSDLILPASCGAPEFGGLAEALDGSAGSAGGIRRCAAERFQAETMDKTRCKAKFILPEKDQGPFRSIRIEKGYHLRKDTLTVSYGLRNSGEAEENFCFVPVAELSFPGDGEKYQRVFSGGTTILPVPPEGAGVAGVRSLKFQDLQNETIINLEADKPFEGRISPVYCHIPGGNGVSGRGAYQSTRVSPLFHVRLPAGETWKLALSLKFAD
jgi:hypothetical protein